MASAALPPRFLSLDASAFLDNGWFFQTMFGKLKFKADVNDVKHMQKADECPSPSRLITGTTFENCESCESPSTLDHSCRFDDDLYSYTRTSSSSSNRSSVSETGKEYSISELRQVFAKFDENGDELICCKDLNKFVRRLGFKMSNEEAMSLLESVDRNKDNTVDFDEFCSLYQSELSQYQDATSEREGEGDESEPEGDEEADTLLEAFRVFDKNQDGRITPLELQEVLRDLGFPEGKSLKACEKMIEKVDLDGNGEIDVSEFISLMTSSCFQI